LFSLCQTSKKTKEMSQKFRVFIGCDHAATEAKQAVIDYLKSDETLAPLIESVEAFGPTSPDQRTDYPDVAAAVCVAVREQERELGTSFAKLHAAGVADKEATVSPVAARGILLCGSGIGICIAANKVPGIRAAMAYSEETGRLCRQHNDANVVCVGARTMPMEVIKAIVREFFTASFEGSRHSDRICKIEGIEANPPKVASA
jgi:ribose 5-phosphate isomerase B